ncbi:uncharacterized protein [Nicotiana sylvestris]|uniref:uncharacterized protein n=1 Tax=Nicotiana sylvestris TaxID=4096 RepID=UPI00388C7962
MGAPPGIGKGNPLLGHHSLMDNTTLGVDAPNTRVDCNAEDMKKWEKNAKAKKWLVCGLDMNEYSRIQGCSTTKQIWDTLQVDHEGTTQEMYTRFTISTNELKSLGRIISEEERVEKILTRVLPITWESKITAIQESKNIATLPLDELIGNLTAYELRRQTMKMDVPKKERSLALRIIDGSDMEDNEMTMITKDFKKYPRRGKGSSRSESYNKAKAPEKTTNDGWYKCGKNDHMIKSCLLWKIEWKKERVKRRNKKKEHV